jgi:hypothetical protein
MHLQVLFVSMFSTGLGFFSIMFPMPPFCAYPAVFKINFKKVVRWCETEQGLAVSPYFTYFSCYTIIATFALVLRLFAKYKHLGSPRCEMKPICWEYYFRETHLLSTILMKPTFKSTKIAKNLQLEVLRIRADGIKVRGIQLQRAAALKIKGRLDQASDDTVNRRADQRNERLETEFNGSRVRKPYTLNPAVFLFMMNSSS